MAKSKQATATKLADNERGEAYSLIAGIEHIVVNAGDLATSFVETEMKSTL